MASPALVPTAGTRSTGSIDLLIELSAALHKRAMYPAGHPHLTESTTRLASRVDAVLSAGGALAIGVAGRQFIVGGVATDAHNALLSDLARRLHRHRIATLRLDPGVSFEELDDLLAALITDPTGATGPVGLLPETAGRWTRVRVHPPEFNRLLLQDADADGVGVGEMPEATLWIGLAQLALSADGAPGPAVGDPLLVARAIEVQAGDMGYDRVVLDYLGHIAEELGDDAEGAHAREQVTRLITSLSPAALRRLLESSGGRAEQRRFAKTTAEAFGAQAVVDVVEAAAATSDQAISHQLLRLFRKLAQHAGQVSSDMSGEADAALRENVIRLLADWELDDPNPDAYAAVLEGIVQSAPHRPQDEAEEYTVDPDCIVKAGLELGCAGPRVAVAIESMVTGGSLARAIALLRDAPPASAGAADTLWRHVASPTLFRAQLAAERPDYDTIESLATRLGHLAADPLLDVLEASTDRAARARTVRILVSLGPEVATSVTARLRDAPWYVQRNLLAVLRALRVWPEGFSAVPYARHPEPRLRQEAFKLLLDFPAHRPSAIARGLADEDPAIVTLVLRSALDACPTESLDPIERFARERRHASELRAIAVRVLAQARGSDVIPALLELAGARRRLFRWRLGASSPLVVTAVAELARLDDGRPVVGAVLARARRHGDPDIRLAAGPGPA